MSATWTTCLQGGGEFSPGCRQMDAGLLAAAGGGPVVITALAGAPGREYDTAGRNGVAHFTALGATDVLSAPDARSAPAEALAAVRRARLLVLPGGSPSRLLSALRDTGLAALLPDLLEDGVVLSGSSAGAMVLGGWTVLPEGGAPRVVPALGIVPDVVVLPHWSGGRQDWLDAVRAAVPDGTRLLGIPEQSGVLVAGGQLTAVGHAPTRLIGEQLDLAVGEAA